MPPNQSYRLLIKNMMLVTTSIMWMWCGYWTQVNTPHSPHVIVRFSWTAMICLLNHSNLWFSPKPLLANHHGAVLPPLSKLLLVPILSSYPLMRPKAQVKRPFADVLVFTNQHPLPPSSPSSSSSSSSLYLMAVPTNSSSSARIEFGSRKLRSSILLE